MSDTPPTATAFAPGHITGLFAPKRNADPERAGSIGAGVTIDDGVTVTVRPAETARMSGAAIDGSIEAVERVLADFDRPFRVHIETSLPIGAGFGVSGATALATALGANELARRSGAPARSENELVRLAHRADVEAGTGLGDVVACARGGVPIRVAPGAPPHGHLDGIPADGRIEYLTFGTISTAELLAGSTDAIESAGERGLRSLRAAPTIERLFDTSRTFATEAGLLTDAVREVLQTVDDSGVENRCAAMIMLGNSVFAHGRTLSDAGFDPQVTRIHRPGAHLQDGGI